MKKNVIRVLLVVIVISALYYILSIAITNNGQFTNHYYYPSNSISKSKEYSNFLNSVPIKNISFEGNQEFKEFVKNDLSIWYDKFKEKKSYGLLNLFAYNTIDDNKRFLRIGYKDSSKSYSSYKESIWLVIRDPKINTVQYTYGQLFNVGDSATLEFYEDEKKTKPLGTLKILIE